MKIIPLYDRVIIERIEEEITKGGIVIPEHAKEKPSRGKVIAVGKGKLLKNGGLLPLTVKVGDTVMFGKYSGSEVKVDNRDCLVMPENEIVGIIVDN